MKKVIKKVLVSLGILLVVIVVGFMIWAGAIIKPMELAKQTISEPEGYMIEEEPYLHYRPIDNALDIGIIIYPGARVDDVAYGVIASELAKLGYDVYIVDFFVDFAVFGKNEADKILENESHKVWYISGHSLGGVMAASYINEHQDDLSGLILFASYPSGADDLSETDIEVLSIYGELDGLATVEEINDSEKLLPSNTSFYMIEGGNHAYFAYYGEQAGDNEATITREAQHEEIVGVIHDWITK